MTSDRLIFSGMLVLYIIVGSLFATQTPPWQAPDEPAHYNYVEELANGTPPFLPVMEPTDYDQAYQSEVISSRFDPAFSVDPFRYEDYQPPLYYLLQAPVFALSGGNLIAMRLFGVILGAFTALIAYRIFEQLFRPALALTAAAFFMFLPQHLAIQASVNNDSLAELLIAIGLLALTRHALKDDREGDLRPIWVVSVVLSLAMLTKVTAYLMVAVAGFYLIAWCWGKWKPFIQNGFRLFLMPTLIGGLWWGRNLSVYGWPDFLGIEAHDVAVVGQPTTASWIATKGLTATLTAFRTTTFQSFWGQFGWMGVVLDGRIYLLLRLFSFIILIGLLIAFRFGNRSKSEPRWPWEIWLIHGSLIGLNLALYLIYNLTYVQHQGRYLFASLIPISIGVAIGLSAWLAIPRQPVRRWLPIGLAIGLIGLNLLALYAFIIPQLTL